MRAPWHLAHIFGQLGLRHELRTGVDWSHEAADRSTADDTVGTNVNKNGTTVGTPDDGRYTLALSHHAPVPPNVQAQLVAGGQAHDED